MTGLTLHVLDAGSPAALPRDNGWTEGKEKAGKRTGAFQGQAQQSMQGVEKRLRGEDSRASLASGLLGGLPGPETSHHLGQPLSSYQGPTTRNGLDEVPALTKLDSPWTTLVIHLGVTGRRWE